MAAAALPVWVLDVPFEWRPALSAMGVRWDGELKQSVYKGHTVPDHLAPFIAPPFSLGWSKQFFANGKHLVPVERQQPFFMPRDHQNQAIDLMEMAYLAGAPGFILADEVGVGKTMSAWGFALRMKKLKNVLIVTTASAKAHWRRTILHAGWRTDQSILIINYDQLGKIFEEPEKGLSSTRKKGARKRLAKQGQAPTFDLIIFDESHKGKNPTSARGLMMRKLQDKAKFCIWASATCGQNPVDLIYCAPALSFVVKKPIASQKIEDFANWWASQGIAISKGAYGKIEWEQNDHDLQKINQWLFQSNPRVGIRRLPQDVANWPAMHREVMPVELVGDELKSYAKAWDVFVAEEIRQSKSPSPSAKVELEKNRARLRQQSSWCRIPSTVEMAKELLEQGKKVAISVAFHDTLNEMVRQLQEAGVETAQIHGKLSSAEKEHQRLDFQQGRADAVVFTVEDAISLHAGEFDDLAPRVLLVHDIRWSAIQMAQIEGRCHRDGQLAPVMWLAATDTVEIEIAELMIGRVKAMKAMHGDKVDDLQAIGNALRAYIERYQQGRGAR